MIMENEDVKLLRNFYVQTDKTVEASRPDLIVIGEIAVECKIIEVAVLADTIIVKKKRSMRPTN